MVEVLSALPARPPTPPRTSSRALSPNGEGDQLQGSPALLETPRDSPSSANGSTNPSGRRTKRVNFSPWTNYIKPPSFTNAASKVQTDLKALRPSNECKPTKSILKTTNSPIPLSPSGNAPHTRESFIMLLESVTQQLAGESPSSRLDAYMHLLGALKAYEGLPGEQELAGKLGLITQFIQRDICRNLDGPLDVNIVIHALKLCIALFWHSGLSAHLPDEFKTFIVDQSTNCLQEGKLAKSILTHYMHVLATQNFTTKVMTNTRITRLLTVLYDVTDRISGNAIVSQRLSIYQRVLSQSKTAMATQSALWIEHLISGLLHDIRDTRSRAISLGIRAAMAFGPNATVSNTIRDIFDRSLDKGRKLVSEVCERMSRMMASPDSGVHVPQIWSVIVLLLRSKRFSIDQWEHFKEWVLVLQKCFNCSEAAIKAQAIVGWDRFVYVVNPSESTSLSMIRMLSRPILSQFERRKHERTGSQVNQLALSSYHNLLYYAFRPSASYQHLDVVWEEYIAQPFAGVFSSAPSLNDRASQILSSLLWNSQPKIWTENKVNETGKLEPDELPSLDSKWVRSRIGTVLKTFESLFKSSVWVDDAIEKSNIAVAWISLSRALSNASSKEIKPSTESMQAVASVLALLLRLWNGGPPSLNAGGNHSTDTFFDRFRFLSTTIILAFGTIPFTEKLLSRTAQEGFQTANTPTHHRSHDDTNLDTPIMHFLRIISAFNGPSEASPSYLRLIDGILEAAANGRLSRGSRLALFRQCADLLPGDVGAHPSANPTFARFIWQGTAKLAERCLCSFPIESARDRDGSVSRDYENAMKILLSGLQFPDAHLGWSQLLDAFVRVLRTEQGDRAISSIVVEPLAEHLLPYRLEQAYSPSAALLSHALTLSYYHQGMLNSATVGLMPSSSAPSQKDQVLFPHQLLNLVGRMLRDSYKMFNPVETAGVTDFVESLTSFLGSGILSFRCSVLETLQTPLSLWLRDEARQLNAESCADSRILTAFRALSLAVANILQTSTTHDTSSLRKFEVIISSGLESSHRSTANRFIEMWNNTFGLQESLEYPDSVVRALRKLEPFVELQLPCLPPQTGSQTDQTSPNFLSQYDSVGPDTPVRVRDESPGRFTLQNRFRVSRPTNFSSSPIIGEPPNALPENSVNLTPTWRLLHDVSQVQFVAVESSPALPAEPESQLLAEHQKEVRERQHNDTSMILTGIRPASPASTVRRNHVLDTPPQLRGLRNPEPAADIPLTPTFPAVVPENEDVFLGSSPTPGSKGRAPREGSRLSSSLSVQALDPPSSPPDVEQPSPKGLKDSEPVPISRGTNSESEQLAASANDTGNGDLERPAGPDTPNTPKNGSDEEVHRDVIQQQTSGTAIETAGSGDTTASQDSKIDNVGPNTTGSQTAPDASKPDIAVSAPTAENGPSSADSAANYDESSLRPPVDSIPDSCSDDLEMQVASQLEQDLELAADLKRTDAPSSSDPPNSFPMTRKRKRELDESATAPDKSKRRSPRSSSVAARGPANEEAQEGRTLRTRRSTAAAPAAASGSVEEDSMPSPANSTSNKRASLPQGSESNAKDSKSKKRSLADDIDKASNHSNQSPQAKRRSSRRSGHPVSPAPSIPETKETAKETPRRTSRVTRSQTQQTPRSQDEPAVSRKQSEPKTPTQQPHVGDSSAEQEKQTVKDTAAQQESLPHGEPERPAEAPVETETEQPPQPEEQDNAEANVQTGRMEAATATGPRISDEVQTEGKDATPSETAIIDSLRQVLGNIKKTTLSRSALREMDDLMFNIRVETHEAARRHSSE
ncbi:hypothetical protein VTN02DRAFT_5229 [Thermoascus thermophilus]